ncbi:MAG: glycosyltransferase [Candidatus Omnitrophica bacterium]|nr:glycosyltransferase [Candidatus Omnitrophota bacterium]
MVLPSVSVVIPVYNAQDTIAGVIKAVLAQSYQGERELIVVDDGSQDRTADEIRVFPQVRYIRQDNTGPASARNCGAGMARGEILFFTDSDCYPEPQWIEKMIAGFFSDQIAVVAGSYDIANPKAVLAKAIHAEILFRHHRLMPDFPRAFGSYNFAIRRKIFDQVGRFNTGYRRASGEDNDLSYKILSSGYKIKFQKDALVAHVHQCDFQKYLQEQFRHGFWRAKRYGDHLQMVAGDDYTFWKDIVEIPLALGHGLILFFSGMKGLVVLFLAFEVVWGLVMARRLGDGLILGLVMWARSFLRTAGLFCGAIYFLKYYLRKNKKT